MEKSLKNYMVVTIFLITQKQIFTEQFQKIHIPLSVKKFFQKSKNSRRSSDCPGAVTVQWHVKVQVQFFSILRSDKCDIIFTRFYASNYGFYMVEKKQVRRSRALI